MAKDHGPSIKDDERYEALRQEGMSKEKAARIANTPPDEMDDRGGSGAYEDWTKEELLDALWPGANVTENALAQAVSELRQGLGDDAAAPQFIRTVARRGYRFIAPVTAISERPPAPGSAAGGTAAHPGVESVKPVTSAQRSIAVLDFAQASGGRNDAWLSAGIAET